MNKTLDVHDATTGRTLGRVTYRPGLVGSGHTAAVRCPEGYLILRRIYYYREGGREMVRLVSILPSVAPLCHPLAKVEILGEVLGCGDGAKAKKGGVR